MNREHNLVASDRSGPRFALQQPYVADVFSKPVALREPSAFVSPCAARTPWSLRCSLLFCVRSNDRALPEWSSPDARLAFFLAVTAGNGQLEK